jgi:hypothetical protein
MKRRLVLLFVGIVIFSSYIFFSLYSSSENVPYTIPSLNCDEKYIQKGNECHLDPTFIEKNTIIIYDVIDIDRLRLSVAPRTIMMNLTNGNTVTFVNEGSTTVNILDNSRGKWGFEDVKPSSQRILTINDTGFYKFLIQNSLHGKQGRIVVLSEDTNSLLVGIKAKMAQAIIGMDVNKRDIGVISVGSGGREPGITIGINDHLQDKHEDDLKFYYEYFDNLIPFDVPMTIKFQAPITMD